MDAREATTMTVMEMGRLLGLKKTDSYYLLHKNCFETVQVAGKTRVVKASFEAWYETQDWYRKVNGPAPGEKLREQMYSIQDIADMLSLSKDSARELIHREGFLILNVGGKFRVPRMLFDAWYASQGRYRTEDDREQDRALLVMSMTVPDMGRLMGLDRRSAWKLYHDAKDMLDLIRVAEKPRITLASFRYWYAQQDQYRLLPLESRPDCAPWNQYITPAEAASRLQVDVQRVYRLRDDPELRWLKTGNAWFICYYDALYRLL